MEPDDRKTRHSASELPRRPMNAQETSLKQKILSGSHQAGHVTARMIIKQKLQSSSSSSLSISRTLRLRRKTNNERQTERRNKRLRAAQRARWDRSHLVCVFSCWSLSASQRGRDWTRGRHEERSQDFNNSNKNIIIIDSRL